jgi:hypothetical protein
LRDECVEAVHSNPQFGHYTTRTTSHRVAYRFAEKCRCSGRPQGHRRKSQIGPYRLLYTETTCSVVFPLSGVRSMLHVRHGVHVKCRWCIMTYACWDARRRLICKQPSPGTCIRSMFITFVRVWAFVIIHDDLVGWPH